MIGCAFAIDAAFYERLWGFDSHMLMWGVEDLDLGLKCWLMGGRILHDSQARIGHRFRDSFDNYDVPPEQVLVNQLRMARKHFTHSVWADWLDRCRRRNDAPLPGHPEGLWARAWELFEQHRPSVEQERAYLQANRARDEFWYASRFGLQWPMFAKDTATQFLGTPFAAFQQQQEPSPSPSPSPSPCPGVTVTFSPSLVKTGFRINPKVLLACSVTATVDPKERVHDITFRMGGKNKTYATLGPITTNPSDGTAVFAVKGKSKSTPSTVTKVEAVCEGRVVGDVEAKVVVPEKFAKPFPNISAKPPEVVANLVGSKSTSPVWFIPGDPPLGDNVGLATTWHHVLTIQINDQFGDKLDPIYNGVAVEERLGNTWININQDINNGTYKDPVGPFWLRLQSGPSIPDDRNPNEYVFAPDAPVVAAWPEADKPEMPIDTFPNDFPVRVGGHTVGNVKRVGITTREAGVDKLEIQWPPK